MRLYTRGFVVAVALMLLASVSLFSQGLTVAANSGSGTYQKMLGELIGVCATDQYPIQMIQNTGGAPGNLDALVNNKANAAFLHSDVYFANAQSDPSYRRFQTLIALWPEPIHVIVLKESKTRKHGLSLGHVNFNSLEDLRGYTVGATGGGVFTARILTGQGEGGFTVAALGSGTEVLNALNSGAIDAAIFVGAAPLPNIDNDQARALYRIIPIGDAISGRVKGVYREASINYAGITDGPVKTLAPLATMLTRKYSTPDRIAAQRHLRNCFATQLAALQDNGSPNWQQVTVGDHGVLDWLELPTK